LHLHLSMLGDLRRSAEPPVTLTVTGIADVVQLFTDNVVWLQSVPEVVSLLCLSLTLPVTSCTARRSFSCLMQLKTFLRSTVTQKRLNHTAILHCHREQCVNLEDICNSFIVKNELRQSTFAVFPHITVRQLRSTPCVNKKQPLCLRLFIISSSNGDFDHIANVSFPGIQRDSNLCLKCARTCLAAGLRPDPLGER